MLPSVTASSPPSSPVSSPSNDSAMVTRRKRSRAEEEEDGDAAAEQGEARVAKRRQVDASAHVINTRTRSAGSESTKPSTADGRASKHETSPSDVAEVEELRRPRVTRARCNVIPSLADHEEDHRPVTRASSKKKKEQEEKKKNDGDAEGARGIVRSTRRRGRAAAVVNRELFRLPTLADLTRVTRSSSRKKPPRPAPAAHPACASGCWDSGEETEREEEVADALTPEPAVVHEVRVETVVDAVFECSEACLCGEGGKDESCDERCAAYSPLPFPGFSPPLCADGDELAFGFAFDST